MQKLAAFFRIMGNIQNAFSVLISLKLLKRRRQWVIDAATKTKMICSAENFQILTETWYNRDYDVVEVPIREKDIVLDVGANHGFFSCYAAAKGATVWAFEPVKENIEILKQNVQKNTFQERVMVFEIALGDKDEKVPVYHLPRLEGAMHSTSASFARAYHPEKENATPTTWAEQRNLGNWLQEKNNPPIRLLKLDCEGSELDILASLPVEIAERMDCIVMEYHPVYPVKAVYNSPRPGAVLKLVLPTNCPGRQEKLSNW